MFAKILLLITKKNIYQIIRFSVVGLFVTLSYCFVLILLVDYYKIDFYISNILSICLSSPLAFYLHKFITFRKRNNTNLLEASKFFTQVACVFSISNLFIALGSYFNILNWVIVLIIGMVIPVINFFLMRFWVFVK